MPKLSHTAIAAQENKKRNHVGVTIFKLFVFIALLLFPLCAQGQVSVALLPNPRIQFFSATGVPLANGCVNFFNAGTSVAAPIYTDNSGSAQLPNPLQLDASGEATVWLANQTYRVVLNTGVPNTLCSVSVGSQIWAVDNVSAFQIINQASNLFLLGAPFDPSGTAGELSYRTDIPCFRGFTSLWDCFVQNTNIATLTNKTLTSPTINGGTFNNSILFGPSIGGIVVSNGPATYISVPNSGTGTTINNLTKLVGAPSTAQVTTLTDTGGVVGITVSGAGATGNANIQQNGTTLCAFDGPTTAGDYVQISSTAIGLCHDVGATFPVSGQVVGRVLSTNGGPGSFTVVLFGPEIKTAASLGSITDINLTNLGANVSSTPILTPTSNGYFRASCYLVVTTPATVSSTLPNCQLAWTDADSNTAGETSNLTATVATNLVGTISIAGPGTGVVFAKSGAAISYQTSGYVTSGATSMVYALHLRLEGPF